MKSSQYNPFSRRALTLAALVVINSANLASAASATWNVATDGDWSLASNWNPSVPGVINNATTADTAGFAGSTNYAVYLSGSRSIAAQTFSNTGTTTLLGGTSTTAANQIIYPYAGITINAGAGAVTIGDIAGSPTRKVDIRMGSSTIANNSSSLLTIANALGSRGTGSTTTITLGGTGNTLVSGTVGPGSGATLALTKSGTGTVTLSGNNTFGGLLTISGGTLAISGGSNTFSGNISLSGATAGNQLNLNSATALGSAASALTISGGDNAKIDNTSGGVISIANGNPQSWSNNFAFVGSNDLNMGSGNITLGGNRQVTVTAKTLTLGGVIGDGSNAYGLTKAGAGTLVLTNANTYDGVTTVNAGVLRPTNANALGSTTGGTTAGSGSIELTDGITPNPGESLTITNSGADFIGALRAGTGGGTWAGTISIGAAGARLGATTGNTLTVTGSIVNGASNTFAISGQSGTGVVILNPATSNTYSGKTDIIRGILRLGKTDALPTGTMLDVDSASAIGDPAVFDLAGFNQTVGGLRDGATSSFTGKVTNSLLATTSTLTIDQADTTFYEGIIENGAGTVSLVKNGSGTLELNGANTYTGPTSLNAGRLNIGGTFASPVTIASGATIGGEGSSGSSLAFDTGTSTLAFNPSTVGSLTAASVTTIGATVLVTPEGTVTTGETYVVLTNSAGFSGSPSPTFVPGSRGTLIFGGAGNTELQFTPANSIALTWKGNAANPTFWDINTTPNWNNGTEVFFDLDAVTFDDTADTTDVVIQNASVNVGNGDITVNNPNKDYTISGGSITGEASLAKSGNAGLTLSNANSFIGGTILNEGKLNINNTTALGAASGGFVIAGGTIDNTSGNAITTASYPLTIDADFTFTGSNDLNLGAGASTLGGNPGTARTITTAAGTLRLGGAIADGSTATGIHKAGVGTLTLAGASTYTGLTTVSAGTLKLGASGTSAISCPLGTSAGKTIVENGASLDFGGFRAYAEPIEIIGTGVGGNGTLVNSGGDQANALESLTLTGNASIGGNGARFDVRTNSAPAALNLANFTLTKSGTNYVALVGTTVTPGTGHIDITGGTLSVQTTTDMGGSASNTIAVRNGATLDCYQVGTWTPPTWSVLMDTGSNFTNSNGAVSWDGPVTLNGAANSGGTGSLTLNGVVSGPGGSLTKIGAAKLTLTKSNTYDGGTVVNHGTLYLDSATSPAIPGNVAINSSSITATRSGLIINQPNQLETTANISVNLTGTGLVYADIALNGNNQTIASINATWDAPVTGNLFIGNRIFGDVGGGNGVLTINGSANSDLGSRVLIRDGGSGTMSLVKAGSGTLFIGGANTYTGTTTVNGGTLALSGSIASASAVTVGGANATDSPTLIGAGGTINGTLNIAAAGGGVAGTVNPGTVGTTGILTAGATTIAGTYACDVTASASDRLTVNGTLTLTNATLAISAVAPAASSYTIATYTGATPAFTTVTGMPSGYSLDYGTAGVIKLVLTATPYETWGSPYSLTTGSEGGDLDKDGLSNFEEFAFGLIPDSGSSVNPITLPLSKATGQFTYQRLAGSGLTYTIWTSDTLSGWIKDEGAIQNATTVGPNESVQVTLSATPKPLTASKLFIRVQAD